MANKQLHPSVEEFKAFIKANPKIMKEAKSKKLSLQELYEDWYLLGPNDTRWTELLDGNMEQENEDVKGRGNEGSENKSVWMSSIMDTLKNMDQNQLQGYIANLNQALGTLQGVISQFSPSGSTSGKSDSSTQKPTGPFSFRKD